MAKHSVIIEDPLEKHLKQRLTVHGLVQAFFKACARNLVYSPSKTIQEVLEEAELEVR